MKKILALVMAMVMILALAACGGAPATNEGGAATGEGANAPAIKVGAI